MQGTIALLWAILGMVAAAEAGERVAAIDLLKHKPLKEQPSDITRLEDGAIRWHLPYGKVERIAIDLAAMGIDPAQYDEIRFDIKPVEGQVAMTVQMIGHLKPGEIGRWFLKFRAPPGQWSEGRYELALDDDGIMQKPGPNDAKEIQIHLGARVLGRPGEPEQRTALLRNLRLVRRILHADITLTDAAVEQTSDEVANVYQLTITNKTQQAQKAAIQLDSAGTLKHFKVSGPQSIELGAGQTKTVAVRLSLPMAKAKELGSLYSEPMYPKVYIEGLEDSDATALRGYRRWPMWGTVPAFDQPEWTPEKFQARLAACKGFEEGIAQMKTSVLYDADAAMKHDWPIPHHGPPGSDQAYRCPKCKERKLAPAAPTELHKHVCGKCGHVVENDPQMDLHYVRIYHGRRARDMKTLALAWLLTGNEAYAEKSARLLLGYAEAYNQMPIDGARSTSGRTRIGGRSLGSSYTTPQFAQAFHYLHNAPALDGAKRRTISQLIKQMGVEIAQHSVEYSNQQAEHFNAYGCCRLATGFWPLAAEAIHGEFGWHAVVEYGYDEDGMAHEGGAYHRAVVGAMSKLAWFAREFRLDLYTPRFKRVFDGSLVAGLVDSVQLELPYVAYGEQAYLPPLTAQKARGSNLAVALFGAADLPDAATLRRASMLMPNAGWIFLRTGGIDSWREIRMNYIKQFDRHESDRLTTFFYDGTRQVDSTVGRISYGLENCFWMNNTHGHNCIVIDGKNAAANDSALVAYNPSAQTPLAVVRTKAQTPLYKGVTQVRAIALLGDQYVVFDRVTCADAHTIDRYQWGQGTVNLRFDARLVEDGKLEMLPKQGRFRQMQGGPCGKELCVDFEGPKATTKAAAQVLRMRLVSDRDMQAYKTLSWGQYQGKEMETSFVRIPQAREATLLAAFSLGAEFEPASLRVVKSTDEEMAFDVIAGGRTYTVNIDAKAGKAAVTAR